MMSGEEEKSEEAKETKPCVLRVFVPGEADPVSFADPPCDLYVVRDIISERCKVKGYLIKRGSTEIIGKKDVPAGDYDFFVTERVSQPQPQGK